MSTHVCNLYDWTGCKNPVASFHDCCAECKEPQEPHTCPFKDEIHGDTETLCMCSEEGRHECAMDI